jgi:DNA-binding MarR family transcriptional regulator
LVSRYFESEFLSLGLSPIQKLIYMYLSSVSDETGFVSSTTSDIANCVGCTRVSVSKALSVLNSRSLILTYPALSVGGCNSYRVLDPFEQTIATPEPELSYDERIAMAMKVAQEHVSNIRQSGITPSPSKPSESKRAKARSNRKKKKKR